MASYKLKYTAEEIDGILESVDEKTIYGDATQSEHGLMSTTDKAKLDSLPTSQQIGASLSGKVDKVDGKGLSTNDYDNTAKAKVDTIPDNPKYTDTVYDDTVLSGRVSTIEGKESGWDVKQDALVSGTNIKTINNESILGSGNITIQGGGSGEENVIESISVNGTQQTISNKNVDITVPTTISSLSDDSTHRTVTDTEKATWSGKSDFSGDYNDLSNKPTIPTVPTNVSAFTNDAGYLTSHQDISGKADKATTLAGYGITDAKIDNGVITLGSNTITPLTSHQSLTNYVQKSQTEGLLKNDGTVDQTQYGTYSKPPTGIPASDLANGVIPTVPTISTDISSDASSDTKTVSPKAVKTFVEGKGYTTNTGTVTGVTVGTTAYTPTSGVVTIPAYPDTSGLAPKIPIANHGTSDTTFTLTPNVFHVWGQVSSLTLTLDTASATYLDEFMFQFESGSTATTLSLPSSVKIIGTVEANKTYQCSIVNNIAVLGGVS